MELSEKKIRGKTPDEFLVELYNVVKWLETFADVGEEIFKEEYTRVLAFVGLPLPSLVDAMEAVAKRGDEMVARLKNEQDAEDLLRGFGIKLEGNNDTPKS